jgi:hypothetical protein
LRFLTDYMRSDQNVIYILKHNHISKYINNFTKSNTQMLGKRSLSKTETKKAGSSVNVDIELKESIKDYSVVDDLSIFLQRIDKTCGNNKFFVI